MLVACRKIYDDEDGAICRYFLCSGETMEEIENVLGSEEFKEGHIMIEIFKFQEIRVYESVHHMNFLGNGDQ